VSAFVLALLFACVEDEEATYAQYNGDDESVSVEVGVDTRYVVEDDGTEVPSDYAGDVDRVTVRTASDGRGEDEYELDRDSAGEGYWVFELESQGEEDEVRTDTLTFFLYAEVDSEE
jgi:hypothetical protein